MHNLYFQPFTNEKGENANQNNPWYEGENYTICLNDEEKISKDGKKKFDIILYKLKEDKFTCIDCQSVKQKEKFIKDVQ